jgi:uracil permease
MKLFMIPDFTFMYWKNNSVSITDFLQIIILFVPVALCALLEHWSDHRVLSNIIGTDLTETPGLHRTLIGDGVASFFGTVFGGLPNTSYGESIATTGFSRVASTAVISLASLFLIIMSFLGPVQAFLLSVPSCVFGGCAMVLYGYIAMSGIRTLINNKIDFNNNKNVLVVCVILTVGVSGMFFLTESLAGVSLAMILGVILNLVLKEKK